MTDSTLPHNPVTIIYNGAALSGSNLLPVSATIGAVTASMEGTATSSAPSYVEGTANPFSLNLTGDLRAIIKIAAAQTLATVTTVGTVTTVAAVTAITNALPAGTNSIGSVKLGLASTDGSSTIAAGGTAQALFTPVNGFFVCNPDATEDLWISLSTTAAANNTGSIRVVANGGVYESPPGMLPLGAVSIVAATTGHKFTAVRW